MTTNNMTADERTERRSRWESFEFSVPTDGKVNVANMSYGADAAKDHTYTVTVRHGSTADCTCPANRYQTGACKHRKAVENTPAVLAAATPEIRADGGVRSRGAQPVADDVDADDDHNPDDCDHGCPDRDTLPCWACYRAGVR